MNQTIPLLGLDHEPLELISFLLSIVTVACNIRQLHWGWLFAILSFGLYAIGFTMPSSTVIWACSLCLSVFQYGDGGSGFVVRMQLHKPPKIKQFCIHKKLSQHLAAECRIFAIASLFGYLF